MKLFSLFKRNQAGDTIVEVLVAIAVLSSVLGGAYASTNQSLRAARQSQERGEAIKYTEAQLEKIKAIAKNNPNRIFNVSTLTNAFCAQDSDVALFTSSPPANVNNDTFTNYPSQCTPSASPDSRFYVSITRVASNDFTVKTRWVSANGKGNEQLVMMYRLLP